MAIHSLSEVSKGVIDYLSWGRFGYVINGQKYTIHDIKYCILRGNKKSSHRKVKCVITSQDPRHQFIVKFDPRIHFALLSNVKACPLVGTFSSKTLDQQLKLATEGYLQEQIILDKLKREIILPRIFYYYGKDFGKNDSSILKWIAIFFTQQMKEDLVALLKHRHTIKFSKADCDICDASVVIRSEETDVEETGSPHTPTKSGEAHSSSLHSQSTVSNVSSAESGSLKIKKK